MKNLTTPKEVFTYIRDEYLSKNYEFICNCVSDITGENDYLHQECMELLHNNKPKNDSFTSGYYWMGDNSWWNVSKARSLNGLPALLDEKRRFLTHLISKL